jgi:hypothetical protein
MPIVCIRGFPHLGANGNELSYPGFMADMDVGEVPNMLLDDDGSVADQSVLIRVQFGLRPFLDQGTPIVTCRFSNTRGKVLRQQAAPLARDDRPVRQILKWDSWGIARDGVFELEWAVPCKTAINGAFLWPEPEQAET